jgi:hypothetical protein
MALFTKPSEFQLFSNSSWSVFQLTTGYTCFYVWPDQGVSGDLKMYLIRRFENVIIFF